MFESLNKLSRAITRVLFFEVTSLPDPIKETFPSSDSRSVVKETPMKVSSEFKEAVDYLMNHALQVQTEYLELRVHGYVIRLLTVDEMVKRNWAPTGMFDKETHVLTVKAPNESLALEVRIVLGSHAQHEILGTAYPTGWEEFLLCSLVDILKHFGPDSYPGFETGIRPNGQDWANVLRYVLVYNAQLGFTAKLKLELNTTDILHLEVVNNTCIVDCVIAEGAAKPNFKFEVDLAKGEFGPVHYPVAYREKDKLRLARLFIELNKHAEAQHHVRQVWLNGLGDRESTTPPSRRGAKLTAVTETTPKLLTEDYAQLNDEWIQWYCKANNVTVYDAVREGLKQTKAIRDKLTDLLNQWVTLE